MEKKDNEVFLILDDLCNQNCIFCLRPKNKTKKLTTKEAKNKIKFLSINHSILWLTGGEPTMRKDFIDLVSFSKKCNFRVALQTNAVKLSDQKYVKELKKCGLDIILVSLHSNYEEVSDYLTQVPGSFKKTMKGIENSIKCGIETRISIVINSKNFKHLYKIAEFVHRNFPSIRYFAVCLTIPEGNAWKNKWIIPKISEIEPFLYKFLNFCEKNKIQVGLRGIPLCYLRGFEKCSFEFYNIEVSENTEIKGIKYIKGPQCKFCLAKKKCAGVFKNYAEIFGTYELYPIYDTYT